MPKLANGLTRLPRGGRQVINTRVRDETRFVMEASAAASGRNLSREIEHRLEQSVVAETLEATLRRVVREETAADREAQRRDVLGRATPFVVGAQHGLAMSNGASPQAWLD